MTNKIGPYGSHNGVGCYTKNCSYRDAAEAGIKPPLTYEEANNAIIESTYAGGTGVGWRKNFAANEAKRVLAGIAQDATPEGISALKKNLTQTRATLGRNHTYTISQEISLNEARRNFLVNDQTYRSDVFTAAKVLENADLKRLAFNSDRYSYDKIAEALIDEKTGKVVATVVDGGLFLKLPSSDATFRANGTDLENLKAVKSLLVAEVKNDVTIKGSRYPTSSQLLQFAVEEASTKEDKATPQGVSSYLADRKTGEKHIVLKYDTSGNLVEGQYANPDGSLSTVENTGVAFFISKLRSKEFSKLPALPVWV